VTITVIIHPKLTWTVVLACAAFSGVIAGKYNLAEDSLKK